MDELANIIRLYESDTFNAPASRVTRKEAWDMATALFKNLVQIVDEGGHMSCDGVRLADMLETLRDTD